MKLPRFNEIIFVPWPLTREAALSAFRLARAPLWPGCLPLWRVEREMGRGRTPRPDLLRLQRELQRVGADHHGLLAPDA